MRAQKFIMVHNVTVQRNTNFSNLLAKLNLVRKIESSKNSGVKTLTKGNPKAGTFWFEESRVLKNRDSNVFHQLRYVHKRAYQSKVSIT